MFCEEPVTTILSLGSLMIIVRWRRISQADNDLRVWFFFRRGFFFFFFFENINKKILFSYRSTQEVPPDLHRLTVLISTGSQ